MITYLPIYLLDNVAVEQLRLIMLTKCQLTMKCIVGITLLDLKLGRLVQ